MRGDSKGLVPVGGGVGVKPDVLPGWYLSAYPGAREASGVFRSATPKRSGWGTDDEIDEKALADRSRRMAASRAQVAIRRYCAANVLNRLGTLTFAGAGCHDPMALRSHVGGFFVSLRASLGGMPFPCVWVQEWHPRGHGLHVHFAVGRYIQRSTIESAWGHGFVNIKLLGNFPVGSGALDEARKAAGYLAKYVGKSIDEDRTPGLHRYEVAQGFQPERLPVYGSTLSVALQRAVGVMGGGFTDGSMSNEWKDWTGPRAVSVLRAS